MTLRKRTLLAAAAGLWMALPLSAQEPARLDLVPGPAQTPIAVANQRVADTIADQLRQSKQLKNFNLDIAVQNGVAELTGSVADAVQRQEVQRIVQGTPGVVRYVDRISGPAAIAQVAAQEAIGLPAANQAGPSMVVSEPMPICPSTMGGGQDAPHMPPYAWPTYAPYNNYSRVGYPEAYPYQAWPFIGPVYPFPKIPLGWRSVKLEWEDGHWWFSKTATKHDWWRLRYW